jgi:hypothetical protein
MFSAAGSWHLTAAEIMHWHPAKKAKAIRAGGSAMELFLLAPRLPAH